MALLRYDLYCDESGTDKNNFYFGALHCSRSRANIFDAKIQQLRLETCLNGELKWTKVSAAKLPDYTKFADIFLDDPYATFYVSEIIKGQHWRKLASSSDSQFLHAYFHFIEQIVWQSSRYAIFMDETPSKLYKFKSLHYCLKLMGKTVDTFNLVDSHRSNLVQLVDVILGALTSEATAPHKIALSSHIKSKLQASTKYGRPKFVNHVWSAPSPEARSFKPNF